MSLKLKTDVVLMHDGFRFVSYYNSIGATTLIVKTLSITTLSFLSLKIMKLSIMILSIT